MQKLGHHVNRFQHRWMLTLFDAMKRSKKNKLKKCYPTHRRVDFKVSKFMGESNNCWNMRHKREERTSHQDGILGQGSKVRMERVSVKTIVKPHTIANTYTGTLHRLRNMYSLHRQRAIPPVAAWREKAVGNFFAPSISDNEVRSNSAAGAAANLTWIFLFAELFIV